MSFADYGFAVWETFYVTVLATAFSLVIGLPLGVLLVAGDKDGVLPLPGWLMHLLNIVINILRSVPFLILLGLTVAGQMTADKFVRPDTLLILALGLVAFVFDTAGGVLFAKLLNLFLPEGKKLNPMIGAAGISAFPMSGRVVNKMGLEEDSQNFLLMYSISVNVSGQIASVIAGGLILTLMA